MVALVKRRPKPISQAERAKRSERMRKLNARLREDPELRKRWHASVSEARRRDDYRAMQSLTMAETMAKPENREKSRQHAARINRDPETRLRQNAGRAANGWRGNQERKTPAPVDKLLRRLQAAARRQNEAQP